ncbi:hypothetical protein JTE90_027059 [Oedothorax gibbosus]|uniref:DDE Tnp4 domain-containing protein n=1 Tax=Oedothorax gibbosus TaxID=931172 RepID=A0AAV6TT85_9ARAC|nr:hypothetical protein JTE90_027059 [Oedothorax gibbosus]
MASPVWLVWIDGTHIPIERTFVQDWFVYLNRKSKFTINVQIICDSNVKIIDIVARWPGSCHDSHMWEYEWRTKSDGKPTFPSNKFLDWGQWVST